ncbi:MAG: flagellar hook-basal body complex protein [Arcobacter sp.]|jgi:flagellar hook-basal body protein|uniref:flagellar hook-basal body complex protein n=1 Tax=Arcobacter sp. TaxID=1872629 RepID=UPI002A75D43D|nr:flagellar hook-basal body complex protein [Arcobacter sp.]MDY3199361.1 flagellar hook-basal body complex protein [Arcobacter sp.]
MIGALWTGISGLSSHQQALDNEANNIANVNTIGYKASRISFADQMYQNKIGKGSIVLDAEKLYVQGGTKTTGVDYDMMLEGDGFFTVINKNTLGTAETFYTRAGNFRMGDNGTLQDSGGYEVQGWMMSPIDSQNDVTSTNPNVSLFTNDYTKLLGTKIIRHGTYVETITAKSTDYDLTAKSDSTTVFSGDGAKTKSAKLSDIEAAIKDYTSWLQKLKEEPDAFSSASTTQVSQINFKSGTDSLIGKESDQVYVIINGNKWSQNFIQTNSTQAFREELWNSMSAADRTAEGLTDPATLIPAPSPTTPAYEAAIAAYDKAAGKIETYKALADVISNKEPGLVATMAIDSGHADVFNTTETYTDSTNLADMLKGIIQIKSLIPGEEFKITEVGEQSGNTTIQGNYQSTGLAEKGSGIAGLETSKDALSRLITGKQQDVYTPTDLKLDGTPRDFNYKLTIYDKELEQNVTIPQDNSNPPQNIFLVLTGIETIDDIKNSINSSPEFSKYVEARNVNGNLVIQTLDSNYDVEFSGNLTESPGIGIRLNEIVDNGTYEFLLNVNGTAQTFTINTPDTFNDQQIYNEIKNQIDIYNATATNKLKLGSLYDGFFRIYPEDTAVSLNGSSVSITAETLPPNPTVGASISNVPTIMEKGTITIGAVTANTPYSFNILGENITYTSGSTTDIDQIRNGLINAINSNINLAGKVSVTGLGSTIDLTQLVLSDPNLPSGLVISSGSNTTSSITTAFNAGTKANITFTPTLNNSDSSSVFTLNVDGIELKVMTDQDPTVSELTSLLQSEISKNSSLANTIDISTNGTDITITRKNDLYGTQPFLSTPNLSVSSLQDPTDKFKTVTYTISSSNEYTPIDVNTNYSGREGAGAEFIEIVNKVDQTASKGSLQLRLDTLGLTDSAFGSFSVDSSGLITMKQDGVEFAIGQIAIARFNNNQGLESVGNNLLAKTNESGDPEYNLNNNKMAEVTGKTLELSKADLSESLVNLMVFQRAFEANAKSITTSDELLNTLINLKR